MLKNLRKRVVKSIFNHHFATLYSTNTMTLRLSTDLKRWSVSNTYLNEEHQTVTIADSAANSLMRQCERAGMFSPEMLRGRGAWFDDGRVVLHLGNILYVDKTPCNPVAVRSRFVYEQGLPLRADIDSPLSTTEAGKFLKLVRMMPWDRDIDALDVAGWCVLAHIGGVLPWRPHIWVVGLQGVRQRADEAIRN
jgi:hypothetical protein